MATIVVENDEPAAANAISSEQSAVVEPIDSKCGGNDKDVAGEVSSGSVLVATSSNDDSLPDKTPAIPGDRTEKKGAVVSPPSSGTAVAAEALDAAKSEKIAAKSVLPDRSASVAAPTLTGSTIQTRQATGSRQRAREKSSAESRPFMPLPHHHSLAEAYATYLQHDDDETRHFHVVCRAFRQYSLFAVSQWMNRQSRVFAAVSRASVDGPKKAEATGSAALAAQQRNLRLLPPALVDVNSPAYRKRTTAYKEAAIRNQFVCDCILRHAGQAISQEIPIPQPRPTTEHDAQKEPWLSHATDAEMSKVRCRVCGNIAPSLFDLTASRFGRCLRF
jgi:hypothetical protein